MTATADRIARLRARVSWWEWSQCKDEVLALCDDYETLAARRQRRDGMKQEDFDTLADERDALAAAGSRLLGLMEVFHAPGVCSGRRPCHPCEAGEEWRRLLGEAQ